jgi:phosphomannomutase
MAMVESAGGVAKVCQTGHAFFKARMRAENAIYGGEMSAHHYFRDFAYCDSGMLTWLEVVAELSASGRSLAEAVGERIAAFPCSGEINFNVANSKASQAKVAEAYQRFNPTVETIDGLSMEFDDWRFNLRASNTEPLLRLNVETRADPALLDAKVAELRGLITS